jgi:hypothetical protein
MTLSDALYLGVPIVCLATMFGAGIGWLIHEANKIQRPEYDSYNRRMDSLDRVLEDPEMALFDVELQRAFDRAMRSVN